MIQIALLLFVFVCVSSIFYPGLRKLALCLITTAVVLVGGFAALVTSLHH